MALNLWSWTDPDDQPCVGVSMGPHRDKVLDLRLVSPELQSADAVWKRWQDPETRHQALLEALSKHSQRINLETVSLRVPVDVQECWAAGVTYEMSRDARVEETEGAERFYRYVYEAERPEIFFKAPGSRMVGPDAYVGLRTDSSWQVPEPELTVILDPAGRIFGYTVGNDMSSRDIEGENPLYLPQAKLFHQSASIGPSVVLAEGINLPEMTISMAILRETHVVFHGAVSIGRMRRPVSELVDYLFRELPVAGWTALMTGTGLVPDAEFSLADGDEIAITIDGIGTLRNVARRIGHEWVEGLSLRTQGGT